MGGLFSPARHQKYGGRSGRRIVVRVTAADWTTFEPPLLKMVRAAR
jgi:hypothetical protein